MQGYVGKIRPEDWRTGVNRALPSTWTPWTPVITATSNPAGWVGSGSWYQVGALVVAQFRLTASSAVTAGTGTYNISLPTPAAFAGAGNETTIGTAELYDADAGIARIGFVSLRSATAMWVGYGIGTGSPFAAPGAPWTWAVNDAINGTVMYPTAIPT